MNKKKYKIQIIAPASSEKNSSDKLNDAIKKLHTYNNFEIIVSDDIFAPTNPPFYANTLETRRNDLKKALLDASIDIIWCFKGGYGSAELMDEEILLYRPTNKILIGFSDITILHILFNQVYNLLSIHGPNINKISEQEKELELILSYFQGNSITYNLKPLNNLAINANIHGKIAGGNLTMLVSALATKLHPNLAQKILLLEDIGEKSYKIKRMLLQLKQSLLLSNLKAILLGDFVFSDHYINDILEEFAINTNIPIFKLEDVGHGCNNYPIILNADVVINNYNLIIPGNI